MRAASYDRFGAAKDVLQVGDIDMPSAGPGEVLVRLHASGINPSDVKKRTGSFPELLDDGFVIPNSDGAGVIEAVGEGVDSHRVGDRVWAYQAQHERRYGTAAEYIAIDSRRAVSLPGDIGFDVGASLGIPAMTAHRCVFIDGEVAGQTLLVTGAAGRVGHYAVQWASHAGAHVIATASNADDRAACKEAGAEQVVNHRSEKFAEEILAANSGTRVDRIIDLEFGANLPASLAVLRTSGTITTYGSTQVTEPKLPFYRMMYMNMTVHFVIVYAMPEAAKERAVADIETALLSDRLQHRVGERLPLADIATGNEVIERGTVRGAVILTID